MSERKNENNKDLYMHMYPWFLLLFSTIDKEGAIKICKYVSNYKDI